MIIGRTTETDAIFGSKPKFVNFPLASATRHGLITGSTGTGKTITTRVLVEQFSEAGVPCLLVDAKGDLSGLSESGHGNETVTQRAKSLAVSGWKFAKFPVKSWGAGNYFKTTISEMGSSVLSLMLGLTEVQTSVLSVCFDVAEKAGKTIVNLDHLLKFTAYLRSFAYKNNPEFGSVQESSIGVIERKIYEAKRYGGDSLFTDGVTTTISELVTQKNGKGVINLLKAEKIIKYPNVYATVILWLLEKFYNELPEVGNVEIPKFVFFIDEAHLLFEDVRKPILRKIEQIIRLIRSKGIGVYLITQSPNDVPSNVLGQLGNKIQHGLRAFTASETKTIKSIAESFVENPNYPNLSRIIPTLPTGCAMVSFLSETGVPSPVEVVEVLPPKSKFLG